MYRKLIEYLILFQAIQVIYLIQPHMKSQNSLTNLDVSAILSLFFYLSHATCDFEYVYLPCFYFWFIWCPEAVYMLLLILSNVWLPTAQVVPSLHFQFAATAAQSLH